MLNPRTLLEAVIPLVAEAGRAILPHWRVPLEVQRKHDDSPVTAADLAAHRVLCAGLQRLAPDIPVLSEEACEVPLSVRRGWTRWWLVDPLDGTKEFLAGSEEFTVNVALVERGQVVFGVVGLPARDSCYFGGRDLGAWLRTAEAAERPLRVRLEAPQGLTVVASRRHSSPAQERLLAALGQALGPLKLTSVGSSLKFCLLAEGEADCYPRLAPTSQWDTAAAQGVLEGAGGVVLQVDGEVLDYPAREDFLNPSFLALPGAVDWRERLVALARDDAPALSAAARTDR